MHSVALSTRYEVDMFRCRRSGVPTTLNVSFQFLPSFRIADVRCTDIYDNSSTETFEIFPSEYEVEANTCLLISLFAYAWILTTASRPRRCISDGDQLFGQDKSAFLQLDDKFPEIWIRVYPFVAIFRYRRMAR